MTHIGEAISGQICVEYRQPAFYIIFSRARPDVLSLKKVKMSGERSSGKGSQDWSSLAEL